MTSIALPAGLFPYAPGSGEGSAAPRVLIIGVGGGQAARVAHSLARVGVYPDVCGVPGIPFLPESSEGYRRWRAIVLGPVPGGGRAFTKKQLVALAGYVRSGGGIVFVGGMDSFVGARGRGGYEGAALADVMPVELRGDDDYARQPETPFVCARHEVLQGLPHEWPLVGERNRQTAKPGMQTLVRFHDDPLLVVGEAGKGRTAALLTTWGWQAQHEFTLWSGFPRLWVNLCCWVGRFKAPGRRIDMHLRAGGGEAFHYTMQGGRPFLACPDGRVMYVYGTSVEAGTLDFIVRGRVWGFNLYHLWSNDPKTMARACAAAQSVGAKLALFAPQVGPVARFHDGSVSGSHLPYDSPWHQAPDFYNPQWQSAFRQACRRLKEAVAPYRDVVAILWLTNEPAIYKGWGNWRGPDFCLNTPATLAVARHHAAERFADIAALNETWSAAGDHRYAFSDWNDFQSHVLDELFADYQDGRLNLGARRWLLDFVCTRWLPDWLAAAKRIAREEGLTGPVYGVRFNYNSVPDLAVLPWNELDVCGKNLYTFADSDAYVFETWDAFRASGLPVLMSEWGVQPAKPPLGFVGGDEVRRAEQAALGRVLASRCPWVVGDIWSNVRDIDFPWGFLQPNGRPKPFVELLGKATKIPPVDAWDPVTPGVYTLEPGRFEAPGVVVERTEGDANRKPGVVFTR